MSVRTIVFAAAAAFLAATAAAAASPAATSALAPAFLLKGTVELAGTQHSGGGGGAGKSIGMRKSGGDPSLAALARFGQNGEKCSDMIVAATMGDGSVHKAHATGDAASGHCDYAIPMPPAAGGGKHDQGTMQSYQTGGHGHSEISKVTITWGDHAYSPQWGGKAGASLNFTTPR